MVVMNLCKNAFNPVHTILVLLFDLCNPQVMCVLRNSIDNSKPKQTLWIAEVQRSGLKTFNKNSVILLL